MTVPVQIPETAYAEDGVSTSFPIPWLYRRPAHIRAQREFADGSVIELVNGVDFSTTPDGSTGGGTLTTMAAVPDATLRIWRETTASQETAYETTGAFTAASHEAALDESVMRAQEVALALTRTLSVPVGEGSLDLPRRPARKGAYLGFDSNGDLAMLPDTGNEASLRPDLASADIDKGAALIGFKARNVLAKLEDYALSVKELAVADGVTDDGAAFQATIDQAAADGVNVFVPAGRYKIVTPFQMRSGVTVTADPGAVLDCEGMASGNAVSFLGTIGSQFNFSANRTNGDSTIALSGSPGFQVGDIIHIVSNTSVFAPGIFNLGYHPTDNCFYSEFNIIVADLGGGVYRLAYPLIFTNYSALATAKKVTPCRDAHWIGGQIHRTTSGGAADAIFNAQWAFQCSVEEVRTYRGRQFGFTVEFAKSWQCEAYRVKNTNDETLLYDYAVQHARLNRFRSVGTQDCGFDDIEDSFGTQSVDFTYSNSEAPFSNVRSYCTNSFFYRIFEGITSHQGCYEERWEDNVLLHCYDDGILVRGYKPTIKGNEIYSNVDVSDDLIFTAGTFVIGREYTITTIGTTDFTAVGAASNTVNLRFVATGVGAGTGTATQKDTYAIRLQYGGARRADIANNTIRGFYGAFDFYGSAGLGYWGNILAHIHDNDIAECFQGLSTVNLGDVNTVRYLTYKNNHHSRMGRFVVNLDHHTAGVTIKGNTLDGDFRYDGPFFNVAFVNAGENCPALKVTDNHWMRSKGGNGGYSKYMAYVAAISDLATFPAADWAGLSYFYGNDATWETDAGFTKYSVAQGAGYYQYGTLIPDSYASTIAGGVAQAIPTPHRVFFLQVDTEAGAAADDLDRVIPFTNCKFRKGDVIYIKSSSSSRDVTIRDINNSEAASFGFQTPGNASVVLGSSNDIAMCVFTDPHWSVAPTIVG